MSLALWTPHTGMSRIAFEGHLEFRDMHIPVPGKDEWGVDTLTRFLRGPGHLYEAFLDALRQGDAYGQHFKLQTWTPYDDPIFPGAFLSYKGFIRGALPNPLPSTTRNELITSLTADELSVTFHGKTIVSATKEIKYISPTTIWRYISDGIPTAPRFNTVQGGAIQNLASRTTVTYDDGTTTSISGNVPAGISSALSTSPYVFIIGPSFNPIIGTPYYECEEQCMLKYPGE